MDRPLLIGIAGGSASGKTMVARRLQEGIDPGGVVMIEQDAYYRDMSLLPLAERERANFDHPDAFDRELLLSHLEALLRGEAVEKPVYDYTRHCRKPETVRIEGYRVIALEGILVLDDPDLRRLMDIKVFIDTDADVRLVRRIRRDILLRGRNLEGVLDRYMRDVRPMHLQFVEPSKRYADVIVPEGGENDVAVDLLVTKVRSMLEQPA